MAASLFVRAIFKHTLFELTCVENLGLAAQARYLVCSGQPMGDESEPKRARMMKIGTHDGAFHCDEALACYLLKCLPLYQDAAIVRTRDKTVLETCNIVVDVGGEFDPSANKFDHHQRTFKETVHSLLSTKPWTTKLSSAGLVYVHYGRQIVAQRLDLLPEHPKTDLIFDKVYQHFIEEIDAIDNGINQTEEIPRYSISTNLSSRVANLNPAWNEETVDADACFKKAMNLVGSEFEDRLKYYIKSWLPARNIVCEALEKRYETDKSGEVLCLSAGGLPWKDHLFTLEEERGIVPNIKYVLYPDQNDNWRIQCVPIRLGSFENRLSILEAWQGLRDQQLSEASGIPDCVFVHASGFIGGHKSYKGVLEMTQRCLQQQNSEPVK